MSVIFICGSHRSGTTSLLQALKLSDEAHCLMEPMPNLNLESRQAFEGWLYDPFRPLLEQVAPRVANGLSNRPIYVEKQNSLVPLMPALQRLFGARFIVPVRDGREVVTSLLNWHSQMYPIIYQECRESPALSTHAAAVLAAQQGIDEFDYSLPRPDPRDPWHDAWSEFTRFEMCAWYWNTVNQRLRGMQEILLPGSVLFIEYSKPTIETLARVYEFIGLKDFDAEAVSAVLTKRVNSLADRGAASGAFPHWHDWSDAMTRRFDELAWESMRDFGYTSAPARHTPRGASTLTHRPCRLTDATVIPALSRLPVFRGDESLLVDQLDLSSACDIEAHVDEIARAAGDSVVLQSKGYYATLSRHRHEWHATTGRFENRVSPHSLVQQLRARGFSSVAVYPVRPPGDSEVATLCVARRSQHTRRELVSPELLELTFEPYRVAQSTLTGAEILAACDRDCAYLSDPALDFTNSLADFRAFVREVAKMPGRHPGTIRDLALAKEGVNFGIRFDVDMDLGAALKLAVICREESFPASFFLLHTAAYHGSVTNGAFTRHEGVAALYRTLAGNGVETGLHVDPYFFYQEHGVDGAQAVCTELAWLRSQSLEISGVTGHNCASTYGVESVEIFDRWAIRPGTWFARGYQYAPVRVLSSTELGIEYEGGGLREALLGDPDDLPFVNDPPKGYFLRDPRWLRLYLLDNGYARWGYDWNIWVIGRDLWVIAGRDGTRPKFEFGVRLPRVLEFLRGLPLTDRVAVTLHPCYFGRRASAGSPPLEG